MKNKIIIITFTIIFLIMGNYTVLSCTIFNATKSNLTLVGNNEDGTDPITYVWFLPPQKGKYGRVYFGLSDKWPQGGMNDQGLFYDGTACPLLEVKKSNDKPVYNGNLSEKMLEECSTVDEALKLLNRYNLNYFRNGEMMIVDRYGNSVIIEGDKIIQKKKEYQVVTNFYQSFPSYGGYPCPRYDIARIMLKNINNLSVEYFRNILEMVHTKGYTQYSNIFDLQNRIIYLFKDSNFINYVRLDLNEEMRKGQKSYAISTLFSKKGNNFKVINKSDPFRGELCDYYDNGKMKTKISLKNGKLNGLSSGHYPNGNLSWSRKYEDNRLTEFWKQWDKKGNKTLDITIDNEYIKKAIEFYPGGNILFELTFNRIRLDKILYRDENGAENFSGYYKEGLLYIKGKGKPFSGDIITIYQNGLKHKKRRYKNGKKDGVFIEWDQKGLKKKEDIYKNNILIQVNRFSSKKYDFKFQ